MSPHAQGQVRYVKDGAVGKVAFDNPAAHNALSRSMWRDLRDICLAIARDKDIRAVIFRGVGGKAFVSGTDIAEFLEMTGGADGIAYERGIDECLAAIDALPMTSIAIVEGWAVGGGLGIAAACDFRIATPDAKFGSPIGRTIANCLSANSLARVAATIGLNFARRMVLLGEMIGAQELFAAGVVLKLAAPDVLDKAAVKLCAQAAANAPLTTRATKQTIRRMLFHAVPEIDDLIAQVYGSNDFRNGVRAFVARDKTGPGWTGS